MLALKIPAGVLLRIVVALLVICAAWPLRAETQRLDKAAYWNLFAGTTTGGTVVCGISTSFPDGRYFMLKWFFGHDHLTFQASKPGWKIPPGVQAPVSLKFDDIEEPWSGIAVGHEHDATMLEWRLPNANIRKFIHDFTVSGYMDLNFVSGSEPPWPINLTGNSAMVNKMVACVLAVAPNNETNPFNYTRPTTQPYTSQPFAPQQPFSPSDNAPTPAPVPVPMPAINTSPSRPARRT